MKETKERTTREKENKDKKREGSDPGKTNDVDQKSSFLPTQFFHHSSFPFPFFLGVGGLTVADGDFEGFGQQAGPVDLDLQQAELAIDHREGQLQLLKHVLADQQVLELDVA